MILKAEKISRQFFRKRGGSNLFTAVEETDLTLEPGTFTVVTGRSGGGKSTLLNMLSGLLVPTTGKVCADDANLYAMEDEALSSFRNLHFGMIPQGQTAIFSLTVLENILLPLTMFDVQKREPEVFADAQNYAKELMEKTGIAELADVMPSDLSGGEMRRMSIARALIRRPQILFADEPTGDLDDANTRIVLTILKEQAQEGKTVFLVTHEKETFAYADAVYRMDGGVLKDRAEDERGEI